jgi:hypothetical protein
MKSLSRYLKHFFLTSPSKGSENQQNHSERGVFFLSFLFGVTLSDLGSFCFNLYFVTSEWRMAKRIKIVMESFQDEKSC